MKKLTKCKVIGLDNDANPYVYPLVKATFGSVEAFKRVDIIFLIPFVTF